jgi:Uma2 family endonuclease
VGLLAPDARVELIEGVIFDMAPIGPPHGRAVDLITERLILAVAGHAIVRTQGAIELSRLSEPQPDLAVLKLRMDGYENQQPSGYDVLLVIEVSESSLKFDLQTKSKLYARHGVPEVWVVDLPNRVVHLLRGRTDVGYADVSSIQTVGQLAVPGLGLTIDLSKLFAAR